MCIYVSIIYKIDSAFFSSEKKSKVFVLFRVLSLRIEGKMFL